jgi:hypothetical protein
MPASDFMEFMLYERLEPYGDKRSDIHCGIIASTIANVNRDPKKQPYKPSDFMPKFEVQKPQTAEDLMQMMLALQTVQNAQVTEDV